MTMLPIDKPGMRLALLRLAMEGDFETELQNMAQTGMRRGVTVAGVIPLAM